MAVFRIVSLLIVALVGIFALVSAGPPPCVDKYEQCFGDGYHEPLCCKEGYKCKVYSKWYGQCIEKDDGCSNSKWGQCGGKHYHGETCCPTGFKCQFDNDYYSQCVEKH